MTTREASSQLIELVRELCRRAARQVDDSEIRAALSSVSPRDEEALRKLSLGEPPARPLGPLAWLDVARGVEPEVASARELGGYYALLAERDALAALLQAREPGEVKPGATARARGAVKPRSPSTATEPRAAAPAKPASLAPKGRAKKAELESAPAPVRRRQALPAGQPRTEQEARAQHILGLFAYHRDAPLVARALGLGRAGLEQELDGLKLRRKAFRLVRGIDSDLPAATALVGGRSGPPLRRRAKPAAPEAPPTKPPAADAELKAALKAIGPRRQALAARLGVPAADLLARFRDAGLERDFAAAERDLIRALYSHHRGAARAVARELGASESELRALIAERSLAREVEGLVERYRRQARQDFRWPRDRIEQVLRERPWLEDLGVWEELHREVTVRARLLWKDVRKKPDALELLQKTLRITPADARDLRRMLDLR